MIILVGVSEGDQALQTTFKALSACGFQTLFTNREQLDKIQKKVIIIGKHPKRGITGKVPIVEGLHFINTLVFVQLVMQKELKRRLTISGGATFSTS